MSDEPKSKEIKPVDPQRFMRSVPSSLARAPELGVKPPGSTFHVSFQRQEAIGSRRWREVVSWDVVLEDEAPIYCEVRLSNSRLIVTTKDAGNVEG